VRVSVALCTFNGAAYLRPQLESILAQTRRPDQIVVSDDGSSDGSAEFVRSIIRSDERSVGIDFVFLENDSPLGVTANFEQALRATNGDLIVLCDQDDVWHPSKVERALSLPIEHDVWLMFTDACLVDGRGTPLGQSLFEWLEISPEERVAMASGNALPALLRRNLATGATVSFSRELLELALPFPTEWVHDEWLTIVAALHGEAHLVDEVTVDYRLHGENQIGVARPTLRRKVARMFESRANRNRRLASQFAVLRAFVDADPSLAREVRDTVRRKAEFEAFRAGLPGNRLFRPVPVLRELRRGSYQRFASRGRLDVLRDLVQPA
jgi:glycosyltransferase involved in cell wall biosynthesis